MAKRKVLLNTGSESPVKQSFRDECDINVIMKKYEKTGLISHVREHGGSYGDFSDVKDYQSALNAVLEAQEGFMTLSAQVRARFENDPAKLIEFLADSKNLDEAVKLGLVEPKPAPNAKDPIAPPDQKP